MLGLPDLFRRGSRADTIRQTGCANVQMLINRTQLQKRLQQISSSGIAPASTSQQFVLRASSSFGFASAKLFFDWGDEEEGCETLLSFILATVAGKEEVFCSAMYGFAQIFSHRISTRMVRQVREKLYGAIFMPT